MSKIWFRAKDYGWGWVPIAWEGWLVIAAFIVLAAGGSFLIQHWKRTGGAQAAMLLHLAWIALLIAGLIAICYAKGERPEWRWGPRAADRDASKH